MLFFNRAPPPDCTCLKQLPTKREQQSLFTKLCIVPKRQDEFQGSPLVSPPFYKSPRLTLRTEIRNTPFPKIPNLLHQRCRSLNNALSKTIPKAHRPKYGLARAHTSGAALAMISASYASQLSTRVGQSRKDNFRKCKLRLVVPGSFIPSLRLLPRSFNS